MARASKKQQTKQPPVRAYVSDGDSDSDGPPPAPVPLQSLEHGAVRDLVAEFERDQALRKQQNKPTTKRARAELAQLENSKQKRQFRETRAEKVVWRKFDRENRVFETYYKTQLQLPAAAAWEPFVHALRTPLAVHVRVNGNYQSLSEIVTGTLELDFPLGDVLVKRALTSDGDEEEAPVALAPVAWADDKRTWKLSIDTKSLRKADALRELNTYLQTQVHLGTLQRLDPATAIIPKLLQIEPGQRILDLCGGGEQRAPGIVELLETPRGESRDGVLVVNEKDAVAAARAAQTIARTLAVSRSVVVTAHKPFEFPVPTDGETGVFDRVVCSAPCSGDGLVRKIPERWRTWTPETGNKCHAAQVALSTKAMALVRVGGALLYYTRSLNPIENEAVVAALLRAGDGAYELVDLGETCSSLERSPGLSTWDVFDNDMNTVSLWETATPVQKKQLRASMWPPTEDEAESTLHLERCVRVLPHQNDTNALFIALIRKVREPKSAVAGPTLAPPTSNKPTAAEKKQLKAARKVLGSLSPLSETEREHLISFFGMSRNTISSKQVMERSGFGKDSAVHVVTEQVSHLIGTVFQGRLAVHRAGVEAFKKLTSTLSATSFELTDDGARTLLPVLRRRVLQLPLNEFSTLLAKKEAWLKHASDAAREVLDKTTEGSLVVVLDDMEPLQTADQDLVVVAIKRHSSYSVVSTPAAIARVKTLMKELEAGGDGDDDDSGYDSLEFED